MPYNMKKDFREPFKRLIESFGQMPFTGWDCFPEVLPVPAKFKSAKVDWNWNEPEPTIENFLSFCRQSLQNVKYCSDYHTDTKENHLKEAEYWLEKAERLLMKYDIPIEPYCDDRTSEPKWK